MSNYLKVEKREQVRSLIALGWSDRRIAGEVGVHRETVGKLRAAWKSKPAKVFAGSEAEARTSSDEAEQVSASKPANVFAGSVSRSVAAAYRGEIESKLQAGLTAQRIWQDLGEEFGYTASYESIKRFIRKLVPERRLVGVMFSAPGEEAQVDFFQGPPTLHTESGQWRRPWIFRMTLCCSRHGYEEAVWDQKLATFLQLHERAFRDLGGVPKLVRHDNLKAAVVRACLYDPEVHPVYAAFAEHWGFTPLPTRPRNPQENGKQERSGGYVKDNALKGRRFDSLQQLNSFLVHWNRTVARLRIHGTTRRQVWQHYAETDQLALKPLVADPFRIFRCGTRRVHEDGHVEVEGGFYPVPVNLLGRDVTVRWDQQLLRVFCDERIVAVHARVAAGCFARSPGRSPDGMTSSQRAFLDQLQRRCGQLGPELQLWAEAAERQRGVRAIRLLQGVLRLSRNYTREQLVSVSRTALAANLFRYKDLVRLLEQRALQQVLPLLHQEHDVIRSMSAYSLEDLM